MTAAALAAAVVGCGSSDTRRDREVAARWELVKSDGRLLTIRYEGGGCFEGKGRAVVDESASRVRIRVKERKAVGEDIACRGDLLLRDLHVRLDEPLGDRSLVGETRGLSG